MPEAAEYLGISAEAVRMRIKRGTLRSERQGGRVYVLLGPDRPDDQPNERTTDQTRPDAAGELAEELRDRIHYLERQVEEEREARRRADTLLAQLMQRIPELEAPREQSGTSETVEEEPESAAPRSSTGVVQEPAERPWWRRVFGG